jgi:hypothetical protein
MKAPIFTIKDCKKLIKVTTAFLLILIASSFAFAQYKGAPVKKDRLLQALRSRQLQTNDIVTIINSNGVDFRLTAEVKKSLIDAGARPEVIKAVADNTRLPAKSENARVKVERNNRTVRNKAVSTEYDDLLDQALYSYKNQGNPSNAVRILQTAAKVKPKNPAAYQMLGFVYLYGLNDAAQAEKFMRASFDNGGSAVFRVFHDDDGDLKRRCIGSLYVSQNTLRFESDDNIHTFETTIVNVDKVKLETESSREWKKYSVFKIFLKFGDDKAKFRFGPLTGQQRESKMVERFIAASNSNITTAFSTTVMR